MTVLSTSRRFLWHHAIHEKWAKETLYFYRLRFSPTYNRDGIVNKLRAFMDAKGICSSAVYESTGEYDLFVRMWLPAGVTKYAFETELLDAMHAENLQSAESFTVSRTVTHWLWRDAEGNMGDPADNVLGDRISDADIRAIDDGLAPDEKISHLVDSNVIRQWEPITGIRFVILIPRSHLTISGDARDHLTALIITYLQSFSFLKNLSLYEGDGFTQFLIIGTIAANDFSHLNEVVDKINGTGIQPIYKIRTHTHVILNTAGLKLPLVDRIPCESELDVQVDVDECLLKDESSDLEFKGSAFLNLNKLFFSGEREESDEITNKGVLKTIVAFLNSVGGVLIVGVLEANKFEGKPKAGDAVSAFPKIGGYLLCGIDIEAPKVNGHLDLDKYQLRLFDVLRTRITPKAESWVDLSIVEHAGKNLVVARVRRVTAANKWFYLTDGDQSRFFVRTGNSTRELSGPEADDYKRAGRRPT